MKDEMNAVKASTSSFILPTSSLLPTRAVGRLRCEEVFAYRREDVYEDDLLVEHRRAVPTAGREVEHVSGHGDALLAADGEEHAPSLDQRYLLVRVFEIGRASCRESGELPVSAVRRVRDKQA